MSKVTIITFGYLWADAPEAAITVDLRGQLFNPFKDPAHRERTGLEQDVYERVMSSDGAEMTADGLAFAVAGLTAGTKDITLAVGCAGGRHRSVSIGRKVTKILISLGLAGVAIELVHRDVDKPVWTETKS
jgi:UPF0042 nucleotide-binding protein